MAETTVSALNQPFPLTLKTVHIRAVNTLIFLKSPMAMLRIRVYGNPVYVKPLWPLSEIAVYCHLKMTLKQ